MVVEFECRTWLPVDVHEAFDHSRSIDLHMSSMAASGERAVGGVTTGLIGEGEQVTWRARHFGVPITMTSRITRMSPPDSFTDEQVRGPFRRFRHDHSFIADGEGTLMLDHVVLQAPLGILGRVAELVVGPYLRHLIERRNAHLLAASVR
jgi:ligand-binding SRPBCC domain-containing protein